MPRVMQARFDGNHMQNTSCCNTLISLPRQANSEVMEVMAELNVSLSLVVHHTLDLHIGLWPRGL